MTAKSPVFRDSLCKPHFTRGFSCLLKNSLLMSLSFLFLLINSSETKEFSDHLEIYGSKEVEFNDYSYKGDFNQFLQRNPQVITDSKFHQHTRIQVRGDLGGGTQIQAVFDDSNEREEEERILMNITGDQFELALGRIGLEIPGTRFLLNNKKALGIYFSRSFRKLKSSFVVARSEGQEQREQFFGQGLQREYVLKSAPVVAGSEVIYLDGRKLSRGSEYQFDYEGGSFQLSHKLLPVESTSNLIVEYESSRDGSAFKNRVFALRNEYKFDEKNRLALSTLMEKDQADPLMASSLGAKPHQLNLYGLDGDFEFGNWKLGFELAHSRDKQDILSHTLPVINGEAIDMKADYQNNRHQFSLRKERVDPNFRSIGKNAFIALGEDSNLVGDVDQESFQYQYKGNGWQYTQRYRSSHTNLDADPLKDRKEFRAIGGDLVKKWGESEVRAAYNNENSPQYFANGTTRYDVLRKKNLGLMSPVGRDMKWSYSRENESKQSIGISQNSYQTDEWKVFSNGKSNFNWNYGIRQRKENDQFLGLDRSHSLDHQLKMDFKKGRNFQSQLEFVSRKADNFIQNQSDRSFSSGFDLRYRKGRDLQYNVKLKQEEKKRVILESSNLDLTDLVRANQNQKSYLNPGNPVQTFTLSQQLRFKHHKHFSHRITYRLRDEEEKSIKRTLTNNESLSYDFKWNLPKDFRLRYRWAVRDRYNLNSNLDKKSFEFDTELSRNLRNNMTLTLQNRQEIETDYQQIDYLENRETGLKVEKTFSPMWQAHSNIQLREKEGREWREDWSLGSGVTYTPLASDLRLGLELSQGRSKEKKTGQTGDLVSYRLNVQKEVFEGAHFEGSYRFEKDGPSTLGNGYSAQIMNVRVSMDF